MSSLRVSVAVPIANNETTLDDLERFITLARNNGAEDNYVVELDDDCVLACTFEP